jgi:hypothetical protein
MSKALFLCVHALLPHSHLALLTNSTILTHSHLIVFCTMYGYKLQSLISVPPNQASAMAQNADVDTPEETELFKSKDTGKDKASNHKFHCCHGI